MQPELFHDLQSEPEPRRIHPPLFPHRFLRVRVAYEDLIFSVLSLILILLAGFCLGVERGKHLSAGPVQAAPPVGAPVVAHTEAAPRRLAVLPRVASAPVEPGGHYVIQLASYADAQAAQAEAARLQRRGFNAQIVKQGKYFELRVAGYGVRAEAMTALATLRKVYHDGFVKRLS